MAHAEGTTTIGRPVNVVFDFLSEGTNNLLWRPAVLDIERMPGKTSGAGATYKQGLKGPGGQRMDGDYEITESQPNKLIKFAVIAGPARPTGTYRLEPAGTGTKVTFILDYPTKGLARLMDGMITKTMQAEVGTLSNLKAYLESHPA